MREEDVMDNIRSDEQSEIAGSHDSRETSKRYCKVGDGLAMGFNTTNGSGTFILRRQLAAIRRLHKKPRDALRAISTQHHPATHRTSGCMFSATSTL
jgi:hypothetical protein